jgi:hypothetical protein
MADYLGALPAEAFTRGPHAILWDLALAPVLQLAPVIQAVRLEKRGWRGC